MRNLLIQINGPQFLLLFAVLIAIVALVCWLRKHTRDTSLDAAPLDAVDEIDPYEVAYLRGQANELARVLIIRLVEKKYLQITTPQSKWKVLADAGAIRQAAEHPPVEQLSPIERTAFEWFATPSSPEEIFTNRSARGMRQNTSLPSALGIHSARYEQQLRAASLLTTEEWNNEATGPRPSALAWCCWSV